MKIKLLASTAAHLLLPLLLLSSCYRRTTNTGTNTGAPAANPGTAPASEVVTPRVGPAAAQPNSPAPAAASTATKAGWWIRLNPTLTTAQTITFQIGADKRNREEWRVWRVGEPTEFDVPANYLQAPRLYLRAGASPIGKFASLCLMYKERGVEHMDFDDDESETKSQLDTDLKCR